MSRPGPAPLDDERAASAGANLAQVADDESIRRMLAGDDEAFRSIVDEYGGRVIAFCRSRLGSEDDALDAAQEIFASAWAALEGFRLGESFAAWLFAIAANRVRSKFRFRAYEARKMEAAAIEMAVIPAGDPAKEAEDHLRSEALRTAVASLPLELREPIQLYYFAGLSVSETASVLKLGEEAVKSHLFRGRKKLRVALEGSQPGRAS
jgi:RNA polymerase sigma factor (sigma-70 family)